MLFVQNHGSCAMVLASSGRPPPPRRGHCFVATGSLGRPRAVEHMARQAAGGPYLGMGEEQGARRLETYLVGLWR